jgi:epoxyqueuosine reductase
MLFDELKTGLEEFVRQAPKNVVPELGGLRLFDAPLVGIAAFEDALWSKLQEPEVIGSHHMLPTQWLTGAKCVISYFLPFSMQVRVANRDGREPSTEWLYGRYEGEALNRELLRYLVCRVEQAGGRALAPVLDPRFAVKELRSNWSERHVGFIAGLGTFGLSRSFITQAGSAGRMGSVVTDLPLEPTPRPYSERDEYCSRCGTCIGRCPPCAINEQGKDNALCLKFLDETLARYKPRYGCGKCQTGVPCESGIPVRLGPGVC